MSLGTRLQNPLLLPFRGQLGAIPYSVITGGRAVTLARFSGMRPSPTPKGSPNLLYQFETPYFRYRQALHRGLLGLRGLGQSSDLVSQMAAAIQQEEGWYPGSISYQNNNPGNLISGPGQTGTNGGFAVFPDYATGLAALDNQIQLNINRGLSTNQFFAGEPGVYAGYASAAAGNNPASYATYVSQQLGIDPDTPLNQVQGNAAGGDSGAGDVSSELASIDPTWLALGAGVLGLMVYAAVS